MEHSIVFPSDPERGIDRGSAEIRPFSIYNSSTGRRRRVAAIVAAGNNGAIGRDGDLPWHIAEDMRRFKSLTMGHPVIMGRRTWESLPKRPLPGRRNIVVSRNPDFRAEGAETAPSVEAAIALCAADEIPFIIGGGEIYAAAFPLLTEILMTRVDTSVEDADTFFPTVSTEEWSLSEESEPMVSANGLPFRFLKYLRK